MGWGDIFTVINKILPDRIESMRNKKAKLERERDAILTKKELTAGDSARLERVLVELHEIETKLTNR
jgi:hypothetical protein